jgi:hypothetical protein
VNGFPYIPLTGFEPSHHLARPTFDDFARTILPLRFRALTEHAGYTRMGSMRGRLSRRQMVRTPHTDSQGGARANLAMSGAARCDISTEARALQAVPPATGTPGSIGRACHRSGHLGQSERWVRRAARMCATSCLRRRGQAPLTPGGDASMAASTHTRNSHWSRSSLTDE